MNHSVAAPSLTSALMPLIGTTGGFFALIAIGFAGGASVIMGMM